MPIPWSEPHPGVKDHILLTLYYIILTFNDPEEKSLLKMFREKEKMLVTSILSFSYNVFKPIEDKNHHLKYFFFVVCKCYLDQSKILSFRKELNSTRAKALEPLS